MAAFRHFSESRAGFIIQRPDRGESRDVGGKLWQPSGTSLNLELDLSFNDLTEVRAGMWEVSDKVAISGSTVMYFLLLTCTSYLIN